MRKLNNETIWIFKNQTVKAIMRGSKKIKVIKFTYIYYIYLTKKASDYPFLNFHPTPPPPSSPFFGKKNLDPRMQSIIPGLRY